MNWCRKLPIKRRRMGFDLQEVLSYYVTRYILHLWHSMARANLNKSEWLVTNTTAASKYIPKRPRICINWNSPFQTSLHKIFKNCFLISKSCFTMFTFWGTFTDSGPLRYVLWCCGSICHDFFTFIQVGSGHTVL